MADDTLQQAISLVKAGKYNEARGLLYHIVKTDPRNEMAWLWLSETMNDAQRMTTLEQGLKFNPESQRLQHALGRLRAKKNEEPPSHPKGTPAAREESPPLPKGSLSTVDRSSVKTAQLTFLPDEPADESPPPAKSASPQSAPVDRSQIQTAPLPPSSVDKIDRSLIRTARLELPPEESPPTAKPPGQPPVKPPEPVPSSGIDRSEIKTARLELPPEELPPEAQPAGKPSEKTPEPVPPIGINRSVMKVARLEMPPDELLPEMQPASQPHEPVPPTKDDRSIAQAAAVAFVPDEPAEMPAPEVKPAVAPSPQAQPPSQVTPHPDHIDRSLLRAARFEQAEPTKTGPLMAPPPSAKPPVVPVAAAVAAQAATPPSPPKPDAKKAEEPVPAIKQQMNALLTESHPSPDPVPVQKSSAVSGPPKPPFPPTKEAAITPEKKPRRRMSGLEIGLIVIAVLMILGIVGFVLWDFLVPKPASPTQAAPVPPVVLPTATLAATNTPEAIPTAVPPPTLRPTFTPLVSPTPTLNPDAPSILFIDPTSCAVKQVSAGGGASRLLTNTVPGNCLAPDFSPDGSKYAYLVQDSRTKATNSLNVANVDGSDQRAVIDQSESPVWEVDWAPDNIWLSYTSMIGSNDASPVIGIYLIHADGTGQFQVTDDQTASIVTDKSNSVSWAPDGQWIAFYGDNRPYIVKPNGTGLKQLSVNAGLSVIAWSPDSRQIAYYSSDLNNPGIVVVGVDGIQSFVKNASLKVPVSGDALLWTLDGNQFIAYDVTQKALVTVSRNGSQVKTLVPVSGIPTRLAWSSDGSQLAYLELPQQDSSSGVLKVVNVDGTNLKTLVTSAANAPLRWMVPDNFTGEETPVPVINVPSPTPNPTP
jgi:Tol biopolymer transport system component